MGGTGGDIIRSVYGGFDILGAAVMVGGLFIAAWRAVARLIQHRADEAFLVVRTIFGRSVLLGLEFLVAADLVRTIAVRPTIQRLSALAIVVAIRTFLSWSLEVEIDGRWPWQKAAGQAPA